MTKPIEQTIHEMRVDILDMCHRCGAEGAHLGSCMSLVEILAVLYTQVFRATPLDPHDEKRDRLFISKGHGSIAMYAAMRQAGILSNEEIQLPLMGDQTFLFKHSARLPEKGIESSSGSLGQGLSLGIGTCLGLKLKGNTDSRVYVIIGDGECNEGSIWEAALFAGARKLKNLTVIIDKNRLQLDGETAKILDMDDIAQKWAAFGFQTIDIDGHNPQEVLSALRVKANDKPIAIIAHTVKGHGVLFAENNVEWHQKHLTDELYEKAMEEEMTRWGKNGLHT